jgi:trk system potassium uptake protein TrkH
MSLFVSFPYILSSSILDFVDAIFEAVSEFTTTGSSILKDIEALPKSILFWRVETYWLGGMGIIVLVVVLFPLSNVMVSALWLLRVPFYLLI